MTTQNNISHVLAHSLWRTGSTALARCFLSSDKYLVFYEPFHESISSKRSILNERRSQRGLKELRHPAWEGGYLDTYLEIDPKTNIPLYKLFAKDCSLDTVYRLSPSERALMFLNACKRVAEHKGKSAFFGFCRSGIQQLGVPLTISDRSFYLYRDPRSQFHSYNFPNNDYFIPRTFIQLSRSELARPLLNALYTRQFRFWAALAKISFTKKLTGSRRFYLAATRNLDAEQAYSLFYLSHCLTYRAAQAAGLSCLSIDELSQTKRVAFEATYGVCLENLSQTPRSHEQADFYARAETRVKEVLHGFELPPAAKQINHRIVSARVDSISKRNGSSKSDLDVPAKLREERLDR